MSRLHASFVLGYHGCDASVGEKVLTGGATLSGSDQDYDWLGPGIYFWEADPHRAWEWAHQRVARKGCGQAFVIGAVIDLGQCLDLMSRDSLSELSAAYDSFKSTHSAAGTLDRMPENRKAGPHDQDSLLRYLDCAVIRHLHSALEAGKESDPALQEYDTVRGLFTEGEALFPGSGFKAKTHVQIAVRAAANIKGYFRVSPPKS
ncbi:hypothetical protein [Novispirillum itersonii]|uniref:hypothetical protein n=1 Tax=Novispirillum itersonii TaxID=189 RepID=UPI000369C80D|nr:hypothetical protein [Novispirillum itersonii]